MTQVAAIAFAVQNIQPAGGRATGSNPCRWTGLKRPLACRLPWRKKCSECGARAVILGRLRLLRNAATWVAADRYASPHHIPLKVASVKPSKGRWRNSTSTGVCGTLMLAPHRLGFLPGHGGAGGVCAVVGRGAGGCATGWLELTLCLRLRFLHAGAFGGVVLGVHSTVFQLAFCSPLAPSGWGGSIAVSAVRPPVFPKPLDCCGSPGRICAPLWRWSAWRWRAPGSRRGWCSSGAGCG